MLTHHWPACYRKSRESEPGSEGNRHRRRSGAAVYGAYVFNAYRRYGHPPLPSADEEDPLLDEFMPEYDVVERHSIAVDAPADVTFRVACEMDLQDAWISKALFKSRELIFGSIPGRESAGRGLLKRMKAIGWGQLAEIPGREVVMGAATQPWHAKVVFQSLPPERFLSFRDGSYVKIAWNLRADPVTATTSIFRTETRVVACGAYARSKFRPYWAFLSPGIVLIRLAMLRQLKRQLRG
jgi:hypothetical protein